MNITVLYDPRGARALFSMKYHYIPLLAILSQLYDYNLEIAAYPAQKFGYSHPPDESYVQNCVSLVEPNKTEKLEILNCLTHCEFCRDLGLCHHSKSMYTPACIKQVKGDLKLLLKCEMNKRRVISMVYHSWYVHWKKFRSHGNSANPVVLLIDGAQESLRIMDTGLLDVICHHLKSTDNENFNQLCGEFNRRDTIQRMIEESPGSHLIVSDSNTLKWHSELDRRPLLLNVKYLRKHSDFRSGPLPNLIHKILTMVIESIVICMDNSDYMRNEDYLPSRLMAQCEAADFIVQAKLRSHPENQVALVTFSNHEVVAHLTTNQAKLLTEMYRVKPGGSVRFLQGLNVAQLVLKHRLVKTHKCRIVAFVGSPVEIPESEVQNLGKRFKKENVAVDVIRFGGEIEGSKELEQLVSMVNGPNGGSNNFIVVPSGANLTDTLVSSNIVANPNRSTAIHFAEDDDEDLRAALEMSMRDSGAPGAAAVANGLPPSVPYPTGIQDGNQLSDDEQLALAIQLSLQENERVLRPRAPPNEPQVQPETDCTAPASSPEQNSSPGTKNSSPGPKNSSPAPKNSSPAPKSSSPGNVTKSSSPGNKKSSGGSPNGKQDQSKNGKPNSPQK